MAYQKKCYRSKPKSGSVENVYRSEKGESHQARGGGLTTRKNRPHRYATRSLGDTSPGLSPTYLAAIAAKKLKV